MLQELTFLKLLLSDQEQYLKYYKFIEGLSFEIEIKSLLEAVASYYEEFPESTGISLDELEMYFSLHYPTLKDRDLVKVLFERLAKLELKQELVDQQLVQMIERYYAAKVVSHLAPVLDGEQSGAIDEVSEDLEKYQDTVRTLIKGGSEFVDEGLADLLDSEVTGRGLKWRLNCLNSDVGELRGGSLGHVFARVDTGKTTFLVSEGTHLVQQLEGDEILAWFNNEEKGTKVKLRLYSGLLGLSKQELVAQPLEQVEKSFEQAGGNKLKIYDDALIDISDIEKVLKTYNVRVVIIDQGDKIRFRGDGKYATHERLKAIYGKFRELAKQYDCDIITAGQADYTSQNQKWLDLVNMDSSKTGKPGELDYAIGIGKTEKGVDNLRFIHVCKNKMKDGAHGRHEAFMEAAKAQYAD